jgi:putative Mn2+ efflux pump MntP
MTGTSLVKLVLVVMPLGLDTFALSTILGILPMPLHARIRTTITFAIAEGIMPAVGLLIGLPVGAAIGKWSGYLAGALILAVGLWMWYKERHEDNEDDDTAEGEAAQIAKMATKAGWGLIGLALSISLDELAVGFSFGVLGLPLVPVLLLIALQALLVSFAGQWIGRRLGKNIGSYAEKLVGPLFCALGIWFIVAQLLNIPF